MTEVVKNFSATTLAIWRFVARVIEADKWRTPPSLQEISEACFVTPTSASRHLDLLERMGKITRKRGAQRGIVLLQLPPKNGENIRDDE